VEQDALDEAWNAWLKSCERSTALPTPLAALASGSHLIDGVAILAFFGAFYFGEHLDLKKCLGLIFVLAGGWLVVA
jgi:hypothetical protein